MPLCKAALFAWIKSTKTMQVQIKHKGQARWAKDGGYDESYLNCGDSKCLALQEQYLEESE